MSNDLFLKNYDIQQAQKTKLTASAAAAATTITVDNSEGFDTGTVANNYVIVGAIGSEDAEVVKITSVGSATSITLAALSLAHKIGEPVTLLKANQIRLYSSTTETGTFTEVVKVDMTYDEPHTFYNHSSGTSTTWYKIVYYNANTAADVGPGESDCIAFMFGYPNNYVTLDRLKVVSGLDLKNKDAKLIACIEMASREIDSITERIWSKRVFQSETHDTFENPKTIDDGKLSTTYWPIISVSSITNDGTSLTENAETSTGFFVMGQHRRYIELYSGTWSGERRAVVLTYTAGYNTVPSDIESCCIEMALVKAGEKVRSYTDADGNLQETKAGNYPKWVTDTLKAKRPIAIV